MDRELAFVLLEEDQRSDRLASSAVAEQLAVLGTFDPRRLRDDGDSDAVLRLLCRRLPSHENRPEAILSERRRIDALARMLDRGGRDELARVRVAAKPDYDTPLQRMLDAIVLGGGTPVEARGEDELLVSLDVWRWATEAVARARRTGEVAIEPSRDLIESRLALLDVTRAVRKLAEAGCFGREAELERLHSYRTQPPAGIGLAQDPAMVVYGIGGVGKSTLVARFVMDLYDEGGRGQHSAWAYLDLDRPTLSSCEPTIVLTDITRQVAAQFPEQRRVFERSEAVLDYRAKGAGLEAADNATSHYERTSASARAMRSITDGSLVVVLDTFEELERTRPDQAEVLYGLFAALGSELPAFRLIVSGRGPAAAFLDETRRDRQLHVLPLGDTAAVSLLRLLVDREAQRSLRPATSIDDALAREIIKLVGGIPLTVRLAATVLVQEGPEAVVDAAARARVLDRVRSEAVRGFLYQRILSHISAPDPTDTEELRQVARASLVLRRVTAEIVQEVLLPSIKASPTASATELFDALGSDVSLAERDGDVLRLREDLRGPALAALRIANPELVQRVHGLAAAFYAMNENDEAAAVERAYHRLATGDPPAGVDEAILRRLEPSLGDLPSSSAELIRRSLRDPNVLSESRHLVAWERQVLPEADAALRTGDLERARRLLAQRRERTAGTELHRLESRLEEAEGDLDAAALTARRDLDAAASAAAATRFAAAAVRLAGLYERRRQFGDPEAALQTAVDAPLLIGHPELRLELLLNRMNTRERAELETEDSRWLLGLDARALLQRSDPRRIGINTALLRLLAAALGREEPERIQEAVRRIGLGHEEDPQRVQSLVKAIATWDAAQPEPGRLARMSGLRLDPSHPDPIERAWTAVAGLGTDAGLLLDRLWTAQAPPEPVREAIRLIYLWWAVAPKHPEPGYRAFRGYREGAEIVSEAARAAPPPHFLSQVPLDWSRRETQQLEEIVLTAYPTSTDNRALADRAGLDASQITWAGSGRRITRGLLATASRSDRLDALVEAILIDPSAVSVHEQLQSLVGPDWLNARGLMS